MLQPDAVSSLPSEHLSHFAPTTPGLHTQRPLVWSQSDRTEPSEEQEHAEKMQKNFLG